MNQSKRVIYQDEFDNLIIKDYKGLRLIKINIFLHFDLSNERMFQEIKEIKKKQPLILLPNNSFIKIVNGNGEIIGEHY